MKLICILCAITLVIALFKLPIGYYTFLRIAVTMGAITILLKEIQKDVNLIGIGFIVIAIVFNPILPIYLYQKAIWMPIDTVAASLFLIYGFKQKQQ
jgi:hypothetical protein